jgi:hypothetical protein
MSGPNAELQAALIQFSTQPGVSTDQAAQLRSAIVTEDVSTMTILASGGLALCTSISAPGLATLRGPAQAGLFSSSGKSSSEYCACRPSLSRMISNSSNEMGQNMT